ncbi:MAG: glycosyltransferase family 2 protein [Flavobacteriaceae bacterium]|nr:glycosyltransferase family 2 protein [Flavobacteriaceae bacterium]
MEKKISVVVVTYNGEIWIKKNIDSLLKSNYPIDIIVVDNASTDQSIANLKEYKNIQLIQNNKNLGFGKANNIGIDIAIKNGADAIFLLNQDSWIFENTITNLAEKLFENPDFGMVSPMHYSINENVLDNSFSTYYNKYKNEIDSNSIRIVPFVNAAAWLVSKKCFIKVGYFDPIFNHYGEDRNFCDRVHYHKFKIGIVKNAVICHDRIVKLNSNKIILQSQYLVLIQVINCNNSLFSSLLLGLKSVFGLPKFHFKSQGLLKSIYLLYKLKLYYFRLLLDIKTIKQIRFNSKIGINGIYTP